MELKRVGFDLKAEDVKPGSPVELKWQLELSKTWTIDGYLHWDRHEGKKTSRAPRWYFTCLDSDSIQFWKSFKGVNKSVESQAGLTNEEFRQMGQIKDQMKGELQVRKSELAKANTLIDWEAEARWQNFEKSAKRCRHSRELWRLREEIEGRGNAGPAQPEWQPHVAFQVEAKALPRKRGCDSFEMCLINLTRTSGTSGTRQPKRRKVEKPEASQAEAAGSEEEMELDEDKENSKPCPKPVSALLKDEALARHEIEEASALWKKLVDEETFTTDELGILWRVAIARARVTDDGQLPFLCLDLVKKHVCRSNVALVRLLCVIHAAKAAKAAGRQNQVKDFIRTFIRSLVREHLEQVFPQQNQGQLLSLTRFVDQPERLSNARKALRGTTAIEVAAGFAVHCGPETAEIIAELFKPEDFQRPAVAAVAFGAVLAANSQDVGKVFPLLAEMLRPGAADLLLQISLYSLLQKLQSEEVEQALKQLEAPKLPSTADELRKLPSLPQLLTAWNPMPGDEPLVPVEVLKDLSSSPQDQDLFTAILGSWSRHAQLAGPTSDDRHLKCYQTAAMRGLLFLLQQYRQQSQSVLQKNVANNVGNCLAVSIPTKPDTLQTLRLAFGLPERRWPSHSGDSPDFGNAGKLSGMKFADFLNQPDLRQKAKWIIGECYSRGPGAPKIAEALERFTMWALPHFTGDSREYLLKLPNRPAGERRRPVEQQLELRFAYANQICESLAQLLGKLPNPPPDIYGLCAYTELHAALLGLCTNKRSSCGEFLRHLAPDVGDSSVNPVNKVLAAVKGVLPAKKVPPTVQDWVFASFARDVHKLMLWLQAWRPSEPQAAERITRLWCVACMASRHLKGQWAPLPQCPEDFKLVFNPLQRRSWPGSSCVLDDKTWASRPLSALLAYKEDVPKTLDSWEALLRAVEEPPYPLSWGAFAEALSGSDCHDWVRLRPWRAAVFKGLRGKDSKHLRAAICSRLYAVHRCVTRHQQKRSGQPILQLMLTEILEDLEFLGPAMEEVQQLCLAEPWAPVSPSSEASSEFQEGLWSFRALLYFRNALQGLALDIRESGRTPSQLRNLGRGLYKLSSWLGMELMEPGLPEQMVSAFREAAKDALVSAELPGITWEEIAPPVDAEDGCFKQIQHTWRDIYSEVLKKRALTVECSKDQED